MIQTRAFQHAKEMARYPLGPNGKERFVYWSDVKRQWEDSNDGRQIARLIGSQSILADKRGDLNNWLGGLDDAEKELGVAFHKFYENLVGVLTSLPITPDIEIDWLETLVDMRLLAARLNSGSRVLDLGPGAGRHMVAFALAPQLAGLSYAGVEAIGLPYVLQNAAGSILARDRAGLSFSDYLDYQFAREPFVFEQTLNAGAFLHLPLWEAHRLPERSFDLILCTHLLDELAPGDFTDMLGLIEKLLAPGGSVYARGSQERALASTRYLFGYGSFHGQDITKAFLDIGLVPVECELVSDTLTRIFVRPPPGEAQPRVLENPISAFASDVELVETLQRRFLDDVVGELERKQARVLVWGDPGYEVFSSYFAPYRDRLNIVGVTQRFAVQNSPTALGCVEYPVSEIAALSPDAVIFASPRLDSYVRELREAALRSGEYRRVRHFCHPIAVAFRE